MHLIGECIDGPGERTRLGYVRLWNRGDRVLAHVKAWVERHGPVPEGLELDHLCFNRWCRNPDHLEAVSHKVNSQRSRHRKLDQQKADQIRKDRLAGKTTKALAQQYGVSTVAIQKVLRMEFYAP